MILVAHAYSANNRGDGLLVDETVRLVRKAFPDEREIIVAAADPTTFPQYQTVPSMGPQGGAARIAHFMGVAAKLAGRQAGGKIDLSPLSTLARRANLIVAVGGGYMRSGNCEEAVKTTLAHTAQAYAMVDSGTPTVYLSQSVGPFRTPLGPLMRDALSKLDVLFVRDDRSLSDMRDSPNVKRVPDLAILKLFGQADTQSFQNNFAKTYLIARALNKPKNIQQKYVQSLLRLRELLPDIEITLQSSGRGNDDVSFYDEMGWGRNFRTISQAVKESGPGVVISVRLHGALQSLIDGCPAVHLSYERKGWGAYEDLGISPWVHNVHNFDPTLVASQVKQLSATSQVYWARINKQRHLAEVAEDKIVSSLRMAVRT
jgi:polysaccharide pyruvyl transferase WcaK-like protein